MSAFDHDVIVVGGGPAGAIVSYVVARAGFSVALLDKKKREDIGNKTCGDALDHATVSLLQEELGIAPPSGGEVSDVIKTMSIAAGDVGTKLRLTAPGYVVDRHIYGQRLLQLAEQQGVVVKSQCSVRGLIVEDGTVSGVSYSTPGKKDLQPLRSKFVVDASGSYAVVRRLLPEELRDGHIRQKLPPDMVWPTYREIIELSADGHGWNNEILLLYTEDIPVPGYFWIFSKGAGSLNVGIGWLKSEEGMPPLKKAFLKHMENYYPRNSYRVLKAGGGQIPMRLPFNSLVFNGGLLVGDAGCLVHPTTAEGHGPALESGMYAGKVLVDALREGRRDRDALWQYNVKIMEHIGLKHANAYIMRRFIEAVGTSGLRTLIKRKFVTDDEMDRLVRGEEVKFGGFTLLKKLLRLTPHFSLVLHVRDFRDRMAKMSEIYASYPADRNQLDAWVKCRNAEIGYEF